MAERLAYLEAVVGADITEFRKSMRDIRNDVGILSETIGGIGGVARTMTFAFTAPMVALGTFAVQAASSFEAAMRNINSILNLNETAFGSLSDEVFAFARTTRAGVTPAVEALYEVFSAGITDQNLAMEVWKVSNRVAEAGLADLSATTNAVTATMSAFNLQTEDAARVGNVWSRMVQLGVGSLNDFLSNSQKVLPLSAAMNISLEDMGATLAFLSQGGGGAAKAETAYAMMLSNLLKPTNSLKDAFAELGVVTGSELIDKFGSVSEAIMALHSVSTENQFNSMFSKTGLEAALRITGNIDDMRLAIEQFNDSLDTATMDAWVQQSKSFAFMWDLMKTALEGVAVVIGNAILPLITPLVVGFTELLQGVSETNPELLQLGVIFTSVIAAAAPLVWLLTSLLNPIGLITAGVVTLSAAVATNFGGIRDTIIQAVADITGGLEPLEEAFTTFMDVLFPKEQDIAALNSPINVDISERIVVTEPKSLWQIYEEQGFSDRFTWDAFMEEARKGGWDGGIVDISDEITITGGDTLGAGVGSDFVGSFEDKMRDTFGAGAGFGMGDTQQAQTTIFDRLGMAIQAAWPKLETALNTMWTNFTSWVTTTAIPAMDNMGGMILDAVAGWFDTSSANFEGNGALYDGITGVMTADVGAAASNAAATFESAFPELTQGLRTLFENVGNWIIAEGIPTVSRSIGFVAGRLSSLLAEALGGVWDNLTGQDVGQIGSGVKTVLLDPLSEGIQEGIGQTGNPFELFLENIGSMLLLAAGAWVIAPSVVTAIATPIAGMVASGLSAALASSATATAIKGFVTTLGSGLAAGLGALSILGLGAIIISALLSNEDIQRGLAGWQYFFNDMRTIFEEFVYKIKVGIHDFQEDFETTIADIQLKLAVGKLLINPNDQVALQEKADAELKLMANDMIAKFETAMYGYMNGQPVDLDIDGLVWSITGAGGDFVVTQEVLDSINDPLLIGRALRKALGEGDTEAIQVLMPVQIALTASENPLAATETVIQNLMAATGLDADNVAANMKQYYMANPVMLDSIDVALANVKLLLAEDTTSDTTGITDNSDWISRAVANSAPTDVELPVEATAVIQNVDAAVQTWADSVALGLPTAVTTAVTANAGNMDASATSMTQPFVDAFTTAFSPEGTVTSIWTSFLSKFVTDITTLETTVAEKMPLVQSAVTTATTAMTEALTTVKTAITDLGTEIDALVGGSPYKIVFDIEVNGTVPDAGGAVGVDGSHAGGLYSVPFDGYIAQLHKGERVLTEEEARDYQMMNPVPSSSTNYDVDNSSPTIIINGVQNFDEFLREAKRRGYSLDKFRR